jgi:tRNA-binding EMAP/Myf-like protein
MESVEEYVSRLQGLVGAQDPLQVLAESPRVVQQLVRAVPSEARAQRPDPPRWSLNQIVAHLADAEIVGAYRFRAIVASSGVAIQAYDQNRWAEAFRYESLDAVESAGLFAAYRAGTLRMLRRLGPGDLDSYGEHAERGRESVRELMRLYAGHDLNHIQQIARIVTAAGGARPPASFTPAPQKPVIPLDVLDRVDLRVGTITAVESIPRAKHVVRLTVNFGAESRTVVAGLKDERADPAGVVGRQALFFYNLAPRRIHGEESKAMLCDLGYADGLIPALAVPEFPVPDGTRAG